MWLTYLYRSCADRNKYNRKWSELASLATPSLRVITAFRAGTLGRGFYYYCIDGVKFQDLSLTGSLLNKIFLQISCVSDTLFKHRITFSFSAVFSVLFLSWHVILCLCLCKSCTIMLMVVRWRTYHLMTVTLCFDLAPCPNSCLSGVMRHITSAKPGCYLTAPYLEPCRKQWNGNLRCP